MNGDLDAAIRAFVNIVAEEKIEAGRPQSEAQRRTLAECGGVEGVKQRVRDGRSLQRASFPWLGYRVGAILSAASMPLLDQLLFEVQPGSLEVYLLSMVSVFLLSGISMLPALRAIWIDSLTALACE